MLAKNDVLPAAQSVAVERSVASMSLNDFPLNNKKIKYL
jgi:hypothetical protein